MIISDDGLQHYRLQRSVELAVFDARGAGNGSLLPAGPLREPLCRLAGVTAVVWNGCPETRAARAARALPQFAMHLAGRRFVALNDAQRVCDADVLRGKRLYAMAGIGDPQRFFRSSQRSASNSRRTRSPIITATAPPILPLRVTACC